MACREGGYDSLTFALHVGCSRVKISRGAPLEVQNGTQQDLNEMRDLVNFGGKKIVCMLKMGGFLNIAQQDLNKIVDMAKLLGGGGGGHTYCLLILKEGVPPHSPGVKHLRCSLEADKLSSQALLLYVSVVLSSECVQKQCNNDISYKCMLQDAW